MKKLFKIFLFILFVCSSYVNAQTTPFAITTIPNAQPDFTYTPGRGVNEWSYGQNIVNVPVQGTNTPRNDRYWRFTWLDFQPANGSSGVFSFTTFDQKIQQSITANQKFSFGVMQQCTSCDGNLQNPIQSGTGTPSDPFVQNTNLLPTWLITAMPNSYPFGGDWYPDYNSAAYLNAVKALSTAINAHILAGSFNGVRYRDVIDFIDVRGYGNFGEWTNNDFSHITPTVASLDSIISYQCHIFNTFQNVIMIGAFSGGQLTNVNVPSAVGYYALTTTNAVGLMGWRRDNWGQTDGYIRSFTDLNPTVFNGMHFDTAIMNRWKYAPVCGEPQDGGTAGNFPDLPIEITRYHAESFGNGNFNSGVNATIQNNVRAASLLCGYRFVVTAGNMTSTLSSGGNFTVATTWQNVNTTASYDAWVPTYELRLTAVSAPVWSSRINPLNLKTFYPGAAVPISQNFTLPAVAAGTYGLYLIVRDSLGFRQPLPIAITGRLTDGSYLLRGNIVISNVVTAQANAGSNQSVSVNSANLTAAASVGATSYLWSQISGPNTAAITTPNTVTTSVTGLVTGTYVFQVCINGGPCSGPLVSQVTITVNLSIPVVANAGADQNITLPTSSTTLNGNGSTGTITSYLWTQISGPNTATITTPSTVSTTITGMIQGAYVFQLSLNGGVATDRVTVNVIAAAPVANAGPNQNISTTTTTLNGSLSTGALTYAWTNVSGPNTPTISSPTTVSTGITGMITGTYVFRLTINGGSTSTVTVVVNIPPPTVANAGANQTITLPSSSVTVDGSGSTGTITSYLWTQVSGPSTATIGTATSVTANITALTVAGTYVFRLSLNGGVSTSNTSILINPPVPQTAHIFTVQVPTFGTENDGNQGGNTGIELGVKFRSGSVGLISGIRFYKTTGNTGTHVGQLYSYPGGVLLAQATFQNETASGWQDAFFTTPVSITANTTYVAAYFSPLGNYTSTTNGLNTAIINGQLTALASGTDGPNGIYRYSNAAIFPNQTFQKSNYFVDVDFTATTPPPFNGIPGRRGNKKVLVTIP